VELGLVRLRRSGWVVLSTGIIAALLFVACGGSSQPYSKGPSASPTSLSTTTAAPATTRPPALPDVEPTAADFVNINTMARVGDHFVASLNGHLAESVAVARSKHGGVFPVGTVIQLLPTEAMVKRHKGYSRATGDWEFFQLQLSPAGTTIAHSGARVQNFFGGDCASCHSAAQSRYDFVCGTGHGCAPLPIGDAQIAKIQSLDPRPK
jgi:hypothetical protein